MFIFVVSRVFFGKRVLLFFDFMRCVVPANARVGSVSVVGIRVIVPQRGYLLIFLVSAHGTRSAPTSLFGAISILNRFPFAESMILHF